MLEIAKKIVVSHKEECLGKGKRINISLEGNGKTTS